MYLMKYLMKYLMNLWSTATVRTSTEPYGNMGEVGVRRVIKFSAQRSYMHGVRLY
eukprot:COSAG01_NODE_1836_length_9084_cov_5.216472_4_plen_55_part_00